MEFKLIKNEVLHNTNRANKIRFIEIEVNKLEEVDEELAEKFIRDIVKFNCRLAFTKETWNDIKEIVYDKYEKAKIYQKGYLKNDGTMIPLIANYILEKILNIELLSYSANIEDIEIVPKGFDAIFLNKDYSIFLCEYKSSISKLNEDGIANLFINGYKSIFCKESSIISKINTIKTRIDNEDEENKNKIVENLNQLVKARRSLENLIQETYVEFNICAITKSNTKVNVDNIVNSINKKFEESTFCIDDKKKKCKKVNDCKKLDKIKVSNIIVIKIPDKFNIETFYENIIKKIEDQINGTIH
jgi:hypothetical protein